MYKYYRILILNMFPEPLTSFVLTLKHRVLVLANDPDLVAAIFNWIFWDHGIAKIRVYKDAIVVDTKQSYHFHGTYIRGFWIGKYMPSKDPRVRHE